MCKKAWMLPVRWRAQGAKGTRAPIPESLIGQARLEGRDAEVQTRIDRCSVLLAPLGSNIPVPVPSSLEAPLERTKM